MNLSKSPSLFLASVPVLFLICALALNVYLFKDDSVNGSNQIVLLLSAMVATLMGLKTGVKWDFMLNGVVQSISSSMQAIIILLLIGALSGTWMLSGIVPAMIYYGLKIMNPAIFLFAACAVCCIVSLATGSSWSTVATVGIALLGIGKALGISEAIIAGAIISGAYFGDKISPLSDTTNLAPAVAGTDLFTHVRYMVLTTVPSISITLLIFLIIGFSSDDTADAANVNSMLSSIENTFNINPLLFIAPIAVIVMILFKVPAIPALLAGALLGGLFAVIFQPGIIEKVSGIQSNFTKASYIAVMNAMSRTISIVTENEIANKLLVAKGMGGMLNTIWLVICAMTFGGVMESAGLLERITQALISLAKSTGSLIATTAGTCVFFNFTASDQYLAIVVPGRMFAKTFKDRGLRAENLSRTLEDSGTVTSVLVPWNTCGATQSTVLGVSTWVYFPYCFFNIISPFMTVFFAYANIKIARILPEEPK